MKAYVITIESHSLSNQAANRCIESGKRFGIRIEKWKATVPRDMPISLLIEKGIKISGLHEAYSRINNCAAAFHSHHTLWEHCYNIGENILIFEHDAVIKNDIPSLNFDKCISIGKPSYGSYKIPESLGINRLMSKNYFPGAHAYMLNPMGAKLLMAEAKRLARPTDVFLNINSFPWLQEYYPWPVEAVDSFTTIQNTQGCFAKHNYDGMTYRVENI